MYLENMFKYKCDNIFITKCKILQNMKIRV